MNYPEIHAGLAERIFTNQSERIDKATRNYNCLKKRNEMLLDIDNELAQKIQDAHNGNESASDTINRLMTQKQEEGGQQVLEYFKDKKLIHDFLSSELPLP